MPDFEPDPYRPINGRRRVLVAVLAVGTASFGVWAMTRKSGLVRNAALHPADVPACTAGQRADPKAGCVGSMTSVISTPAAPASGPR
jgi:hypothetical protein